MELTTRERLILKMVCNEKTNQQIAEKLEVGLRRAEKHRQALYIKIKVKTGIGLYKWALKNGYVKLK